MFNQKSNRVLTFFTAGLMAFVLAACAGQTGRSAGTVGREIPVNGAGSYINLTPSQLDQLLTEQDPFFVNVHIPYEGEIPDTDAFIPFNEIQQQVEEFPDEQSTAIVVYCRSGSMSTSAAEELVRLGYSRVYNLEGGFRAWANAGQPFINP